jgi:tRNA (cmo5U34)-methyltransferase
MSDINDELSVFGKEHALSHDNRLSKLAPIRDSLHLLMQMVLSELPVDANILCIGAGTGLELVALAHAFPQWKFTAVEPASAMLSLCRKRAKENGILSRCTFHEGYLDSLPGNHLFHATTSILVSQFITNHEERCAYFKTIKNRLIPNGYLVNADLASDLESSSYSDLFEVWKRTMVYSKTPIEEVEKLEKNVSIIPLNEIESILKSSGFNNPILFYQSLLIHAWFARLGT